MPTPDILQARQKKLTSSLAAHGLDAVALNPGPSLTYLTGLHFHLSERPIVFLLAAGSPPAIVLPELETAKLEILAFEVQAWPYGERPDEWGAAFQGAVDALGLAAARVGVEPRRMRLLEMRFLEQAAPQARFPSAEGVLAAVRMYKDAAEVDAMRRAAKIAQKALQAALAHLRLGMTEKELAGELVVQLLRHGSHPQMPFSPIVSFGPNSANPHATPTERKLAAGDLLLVDWGAAVEDYFSDITRTFAVGEVDAELLRIANVVREANRAAREVAGPGVPCSEVDRAARQVIAEAGYGPYFIHRTGHGLGMEGHEEPYIRADNPQRLQPGMTFTIEPGIYLPGRGGVRIEDDVLVTEHGLESFTDLPRALVQIG